MRPSRRANERQLFNDVFGFKPGDDTEANSYVLFAALGRLRRVHLLMVVDGQYGSLFNRAFPLAVKYSRWVSEDDRARILTEEAAKLIRQGRLSSPPTTDPPNPS